MSSDLICWPQFTLTPADISANPVAFTRGGGRSLGGIERTTRTDRGFWSIDLKNITLSLPAQRRTWHAIKTSLGGRAGLIVVPVRAREAAPYPAGVTLDNVETTHSDGTCHSDGTNYAQGTISVEMAEAAAIGDTVVTLRAINAGNLVGIKFSYGFALYETGAAISIDGDEWEVPVFPAIRRAIPEGAALECNLPKCLCHLAADNGMDLNVSPPRIDRASVSFVEATDYWSDLAAA